MTHFQLNINIDLLELERDSGKLLRNLVLKKALFTELCLVKYRI